MHRAQDFTILSIYKTLEYVPVDTWMGAAVIPATSVAPVRDHL